MDTQPCGAAARMLALAAALAAPCAEAQTPPIRPGLWEAATERGVDGQKPAPPRNLDHLSPEVRAKVEAMLREKGIAIGAGGAARICLTREFIDRGSWHDIGAHCKTDYLSRTASAWKWHSSCTQPEMTSDGEATFAGPERYTVKTTMTSTIKGVAKNSQLVVHAKWLAADCGGLKPLQLGP